MTITDAYRGLVPMSFRNLSIGCQISISFGLLIVLAVTGPLLTLACVQKIAHLQHMRKDYELTLQAVHAADRVLDDVTSDLNALGPNSTSQREKVRADLGRLFKARAILESRLDTADIPELQNIYFGTIDNVMRDAIAAVGDLGAKPTGTPEELSPSEASWHDALSDIVHNLHRAIINFARFNADARDGALNNLITLVSVCGVACIFIGGLMAWLLKVSIGGPLGDLLHAMLQLTKGNTDLGVPGLAQSNEFGRMAGAIEALKADTLKKLKLESAINDAQQQCDAERARLEAERSEIHLAQTASLSALSAGFARLAQGDLTAHIAAPFPVQQDAMRLKFNDVVQQFASKIKLSTADYASKLLH